VRELEWTESALEDMTALDKGIARRVKQAVERFAAIGSAM
jgi:phage-related protein